MYLLKKFKCMFNFPLSWSGEIVQPSLCGGCSHYGTGESVCAALYPK